MWTEWHQLRFARTDVLALWPPRNVDEATTHKEAKTEAPKPAAGAVSEAKAREWFRRRLEHWPPESISPTEEQDIEAAKKELPGIGRAMVRKMRQNIYPTLAEIRPTEG
jgi:hypothetical protein